MFLSVWNSKDEQNLEFCDRAWRASSLVWNVEIQQEILLNMLLKRRVGVRSSFISLMIRTAPYRSDRLIVHYTPSHLDWS